MLRALMLSLAILTFTACGGDDPSGDGGGGDVVVKPSKEAIVALLKSLEAANAAGDLDKAVTYLVPFGNLKSSDIPKLLEREGVNTAAIDKLAEKGAFGPLAEIYPERGEYFAKKAGVALAECYALRADPAEIAVHFDGKQLRFIRIDDLHKLR